MKKWFFRGLAFLILFLALQGPLLIEQYVDHLTGHTEELRFQVDRLKELTGKQDAELKPLIATWVEKGEPKEPAIFISGLYERFLKLTKDLEAFRAAPFWTVPYTFMTHLDTSILQETLSNYKWGFALTLSAIPFLLIGLLFAYLAILPFQPRKKEPEEPPSEP